LDRRIFVLIGDVRSVEMTGEWTCPNALLRGIIIAVSSEEVTGTPHG